MYDVREHTIPLCPPQSYNPETKKYDYGYFVRAIDIDPDLYKIYNNMTTPSAMIEAVAEVIEEMQELRSTLRDDIPDALYERMNAWIERLKS